MKAVNTNIVWLDEKIESRPTD